jgi:Family of unknown function (DUF5684)
MKATLDLTKSVRRAHNRRILLTLAGGVGLILGDVLLAQGLSHSLAPNRTQAVWWAAQTAVWCGWTALMFWYVFPKAGGSRWWSAVPILNLVGLCRVAGRGWWWIPASLAPTMILSLLSLLVFDAQAPSQQALDNNPYAGLPGAGDLLMIGLTIVVFLVSQLWVWTDLARRVSARFGHGGAFGAGLFLLPFVFYPILGLRDGDAYSRKGTDREFRTLRVRPADA